MRRTLALTLLAILVTAEGYNLAKCTKFEDVDMAGYKKHPAGPWGPGGLCTYSCGKNEDTKRLVFAPCSADGKDDFWRTLRRFKML
ncbi:hypothetical protein AAVH_16234 [Aphelenchoides avenae]|nr:hypothetical protein AAVH_16234 [Aphelenchus avenae]